MTKKLIKRCKKNSDNCKKIIMKHLKLKKKYSKLSKKDIEKVNTLYQKIMYKKKYDYISFPMEEYSGEILEKFDTIYDFDIDDYKYQKKHNSRSVRPTYDTLYLKELPFTALEKNFIGKRKLIYGEMVSAREYILYRVYEKLDEYIENKYPSINILPYEKRKNIKNIFKHLETRVLENSDTRKELYDKLFRYRNKIENYIIDKLVKYERYTFRLYDNNYIYFIIGGIESAENIRFKSFFKDFISREQSGKYIEKIIDETFNYFKNYLEKSSNIIEN